MPRERPALDEPVQGMSHWPAYSDLYRQGSWFWSPPGQKQWPRDRHQKGRRSIFLARAVLKLGQARFPQDWHDDDPGLERYSGAPCERLPETGNPVHDTVADKDRRRLRMLREANERSDSVQSEIMLAAESGRLILRHGPANGSAPLVDCPDWWFGGEDWSQFFYECSVDPVQPWRKQFTPYRGAHHALWVDAEQLEALIARAEGKAVQASASPSPPKRRGPRQMRWDWTGAWAHLTVIADQDGLVGKCQADIEREVADWFANRNDGRTPAPSHIRSQVVRFYEQQDENNRRKAEGQA